MRLNELIKIFIDEYRELDRMTLSTVVILKRDKNDVILYKRLFRIANTEKYAAVIANTSHGVIVAVGNKEFLEQFSIDESVDGTIELPVYENEAVVHCDRIILEDLIKLYARKKKLLPYVIEAIDAFYPGFKDIIESSGLLQIIGNLKTITDALDFKVSRDNVALIIYPTIRRYEIRTPARRYLGPLRNTTRCIGDEKLVKYFRNVIASTVQSLQQMKTQLKEMFLLLDLAGVR